MKKSDRLPAKYGKLNPYERLSLLTHAMARDDRSEIDALNDTAPMIQRPFCHHAFLLNAFLTLTSEYVVDQLVRAARLCLFSLASDECPNVPSSVRLVAFDFLQHQAAWRQFSQMHGISPGFPECEHPGTASTLRLAAEIARRLALSPEQARAHVAGDPRAQPTTVEQIIADWQQLLDRLAIPPLPPDNSTDDSGDYTDTDNITPEAGDADDPNEDEQVSDIGRTLQSADARPTADH